MRTNGELTRGSIADRSAYQHPNDRLTVADAARLMDLSAEAVRMRIKRGTLASEKISGTVYVILEYDQTRTNGNLNREPTVGLTTDQTALVEALRSEVSFLRETIKARDEELSREREAQSEEKRRHDTIVLQLAQRIPELEASPSARGGNRTASENRSSNTPESYREDAQRRSWWRRFFGLQ